MYALLATVSSIPTSPHWQRRHERRPPGAALPNESSSRQFYCYYAIATMSFQEALQSLTALVARLHDQTAPLASHAAARAFFVTCRAADDSREQVAPQLRRELERWVHKRTAMRHVSAPCFLATVFVLPARTQRYAAPPVCCRCVVRAGTALERLSGPLAQAASAASAVGGGGVHVLQLPAHLSLLGYAYIIRGCSVLCTAAALGEAAAVQLCRAAGPLLTGAGLTMLAGGGSSRRSGSGDMPLAALTRRCSSWLRSRPVSPR